MTQAQAQTIRVLLVEDHVMVGAGLRLLIESRPGLVVVGQATCHADALALVERKQPDLILLDLDLDTESGLDLLPKLLAAAPQTQVLIVTGMSDALKHRQAILQGAMGLVLKAQAPEVLLKAIEKVYAGEVWFDRALLASVLGEITAKEQKPASPEAARIATLTEREREVIALVGEGLKNRQISERLSITETTVRHHLTSIFAKLGVGSRLELVLFAHHHGIATWPS